MTKISINATLYEVSESELSGIALKNLASSPVFIRADPCDAGRYFKLPRGANRNRQISVGAKDTTCFSTVPEYPQSA